MHFPHFLLAQERKFPAENQVPGGLCLLSNLLCWHQASTELGGDNQEGIGAVVVGREKDGAADGNLRGGSFPLDLPLIISGTRDPLHFPEALFMGIAALGAYGALPASSKGSGHLLPHQEQPQGMKAEGLTAPPAPHQPYHTGSGSILTACTPQSRRTTLPKPRHCVCAPVWAVPPFPGPNLLLPCSCCGILGCSKPAEPVAKEERWERGFTAHCEASGAAGGAEAKLWGEGGIKAGL